MNHFAAVCRSQSVNEVEESDDSGQLSSIEKVTFLGLVDDETNKDKRTTVLKINHGNVAFKIDTGADVTVISAAQFYKFSSPPKLQKPTTLLRSAGGMMECLGQFDTLASMHNKQYKVRIYVVNSKTDNLLSREASSRMGRG